MLRRLRLLKENFPYKITISHQFQDQILSVKRLNKKTFKSLSYILKPRFEVRHFLRTYINATAALSRFPLILPCSYHSTRVFYSTRVFQDLLKSRFVYQFLRLLNSRLSPNFLRMTGRQLATYRSKKSHRSAYGRS
jgi:hypothetical protein